MRRAAVRRAGVGPRPHTHRGGRHRRALESHGGRRAHTLLPHTPLLPTPLSFPNRPASTRCSHTTPPSHRSLTAPTPPQQRLHTPPRPPRALRSAGRVCRGCGRSCARGEPRCEGPLRARGDEAWVESRPLLSGELRAPAAEPPPAELRGARADAALEAALPLHAEASPRDRGRADPRLGAPPPARDAPSPPRRQDGTVRCRCCR